MKKMKPILFLVIMLQLSGLYGQDKDYSWDRINTSSNRLGGKLTGTMYYINALANRHYFLHQTYLNGTILYDDGELFENQRLRYFVHKDELVVYNQNLRQLFIADKEKIRRFTIYNNNNKDTLHFVKLHYDGFPSGYRYFEELFNGSRSLLAFHFIEERKTSPFRDERGVLRDTYYYHREKYYMYSEDSGFIKLYNSRRVFFKIFPEKKRQIKKLLRRNRLNTFEKEGFIRAFQLLQREGIFE